MVEHEPAIGRTLPPPLPPMPRPSPTKRGWLVVVWGLILLGEAATLGWIWSLGDVGYDVEKPPTQVDEWWVLPTVLTALVVLGLTALTGIVVVRARRGALGRPRWLATIAAGILAVGGGVAMFHGATGHCYRVPAPGVGLVDRVSCIGKASIFRDYLEFYDHIPWVVIGTGVVVVLLSLAARFIVPGRGDGPA